MTNKVIYSKAILASALVIGATAFTACSSETDITADSASQVAAAKAITFDAYVNGEAARAEITSANITDQTINIYGYKIKGSDAPISIYKDAAASTDGTTLKFESGKWKCGISALWEDGYTYDFFAIAPVAATKVTDDSTGKTMTVEKIPVISTVTDGNDIVYATSTAVAGPNEVTEGNVPLDFAHAMAKLTVKTYTSIPASQDKITLKSLKLVTPKASALTYTFDAATSANTKIDWTGWKAEEDAAVATALAATAEADVTTKGALEQHEIATAGDLYAKEATSGVELQEGINWATEADADYLLAPFAKGEATYYLVATFSLASDSNTTFVKVVKISDFDDTGVVAGTHYTLYVDVCPNIIKPYVQKLAGWTEKDLSAEKEIITIPSKN